MKFEDSSQNLRARLRFLQAMVVLLLGVLRVWLYVLQVVRGERYGEIAQNQRRPPHSPDRRWRWRASPVTVERDLAWGPKNRDKS